MILIGNGAYFILSPFVRSNTLKYALKLPKGRLREDSEKTLKQFFGHDTKHFSRIFKSGYFAPIRAFQLFKCLRNPKTKRSTFSKGF